MGRKKSVKPATAHAHDKTAPEDQRFGVIDGSSLSTLRELAQAFDTMSDDSFYYHVNDQKNDFANWVRHVFEDEQLASKMQEARTREQSLIAVLKHLLGM